MSSNEDFDRVNHYKYLFPITIITKKGLKAR